MVVIKCKKCAAVLAEENQWGVYLDPPNRHVIQLPEALWNLMENTTKKIRNPAKEKRRASPYKLACRNCYE